MTVDTCKKCPWWSGILLYGRCHNDKSSRFGQVTKYNYTCIVNEQGEDSSAEN
jgi:hypothetical protein